MEQHNSGANIYIWEQDIQSWVGLEEAYFQEAKTYHWKFDSKETFSISMQNVPLPMILQNNGWGGTFETPFQSGAVSFRIHIGDNSKIISTFIYPDERKLALEQYNQLLEEILEEAAVCFQLSGLELNVKATGFAREQSMLQWFYIEQNIIQLRSIFSRIDSKPLRILKNKDEILKREFIKRVTTSTLSWMERYGESYGGSPTRLPSHLLSSRSEETFNIYENQVILSQLNDLQTLLLKYKDLSHVSIREKATRYLDRVSMWKRSDFLNKVKTYTGPIKITQTFRKHPMYRLWYNWFQNLYRLKDIEFDLEDRLSIKDTFQLYEIWCFMKIVKFLREMDLIEKTTSLFTCKDFLFYLNLGENRESTVLLKNGAKLTYQRVFQNNSNPYYTFTQRMIPDIVIEKNGQLFILDPKYRVAANLSTALGEMHKYRDGILQRGTESKVVKEVYILTPGKASMSDEKDFYDKGFQSKYKMGAFCMTPSENMEGMKAWLKKIMVS